MNDASRKQFQNFLEEFCCNHHGELTEDDRMPFRFFSNYLTVKEVEAECIDWVIQYLTSKCPDLLAARIARTVADYVLEIDLHKFVAEDEDDLDKEDFQVEEEKLAMVEEKALEPETVLLVSALAPVVFTKVHAVCEAWNHSMPDSILISNAKSPVFHQMAVHATKNGRRKMEDRHVVLPYLGEVYKLKSRCDQSYFAVFDGHGGLYASIYASAHFHDNLVKHSDFESDPAKAIKDTFRQTDEDFCNKALRESLGSGTTGVCALLQGDMLYVGWLGDSEALLVKDGRPVTLVTPHKPERKDEQERIEALGGFVECTDVYRVNGFISVARAIGDRNLKPYLCSDADITSVQLDGTEDYVVLACDGLWDVVTHDEIVTHVHQHIEDNGDKSGVAQMLIRLAQEYESEDNITVVVVFFKEKLGKPRVSSDEQKTVDVLPSTDLTNADKTEMVSGSSSLPEGNSQDADLADVKSSEELGANLKCVNVCNICKQQSGSEEVNLQKDSIKEMVVLSSNPSDELNDKLTYMNKERDPVVTEQSTDREMPEYVEIVNTKEIMGKADTSVSQEAVGSKDTSGDKEVSGDREISGSRECTGSKEVLLSWNKGSSGVTSYGSPHPNVEKLRLSLKHLSQQDSKDSSEAAKETHEKSSSKSSKVRALHLETLSGGSGGSDLVLMSQTASKCVGYRRGRRGRNGRRRNNHRENRRLSKESQSSGVALRTNGISSRIRSSSESKVSAFAHPSEMSHAHTGKDGVFRMLMGYNPSVTHRPKSHNRWTVAVAMETDSAAAMFDDIAPKTELAALPHRKN